MEVLGAEPGDEAVHADAGDIENGQSNLAVGAQEPAGFGNESFCNDGGGVAGNGGHGDSFSVRNMHNEQPTPPQGGTTPLQWPPVGQQPRPGAPGGNGNEGTAAPSTVLGSFHWTLLMPYLYTLLLVLVSCVLGHFSVSGAVFFALFILHSFAYYGYRDYNDPIDILTSARDANKSTRLRQIFKWALLVAAGAYLAVLLVAHAGAEYTDVRVMLQDEDQERLRRHELLFEKELDKMIPDCLSYWNFLVAAVLLVASGALFKI